MNAAQPRQDGLHCQASKGHSAPAGLARVQDIDLDATAPRERSPPADAGLAGMGDWQELLNAVKARLRQTVRAPAAGQPDFRHIQACVLDCVTALDQIQALLAHELRGGDPLNREPQQTQSGVAQSPVTAALADPRAEDMRASPALEHDSPVTVSATGEAGPGLRRAVAEPSLQTGPA